MKRQKLFITAMAALLLCACGSKAGNAVGQDSAAVAAPGPDYVTKTTIRNYVSMTTYIPSPGEHYGISAERKHGKVYVTVDPDKFEKAPFASGMDFRLNEKTYEVQNTDDYIVSLFIGDIGQDYNPVLCMLREDGKVQIVDIFDGISRFGFFQASWPLPGLKNIVDFKAGNYEDHVGIAAIAEDGSETEVPYNPIAKCDFVNTTSAGTNLVFTFTPDWKFACKHFITGPDGGVKEIKEYLGEYASTPTESDANNSFISYTIHTLANVLADDNAPKPYTDKGTFLIEQIDEFGRQLAIIPQTGKMLPLPKGKPATFNMDEQ